MEFSSICKWFGILMLSMFSWGCSAAENGKGNSCLGKPANQFYSTYTVFDVVRYGGGLTTETEAETSVNKHVFLASNGFEFVGTTIEQPSYKFRCYQLPPEGEVDANRWSNFYGFGLSRNSIEVIEVYDLDGTDNEPSYYLEVVDDQLWLLHDGWLYKMYESKESDSIDF